MTVPLVPPDVGRKEFGFRIAESLVLLNQVAENFTTAVVGRLERLEERLDQVKFRVDRANTWIEKTTGSKKATKVSGYIFLVFLQWESLIYFLFFSISRFTPVRTSPDQSTRTVYALIVSSFARNSLFLRSSAWKSIRIHWRMLLSTKPCLNLWVMQHSKKSSSCSTSKAVVVNHANLGISFLDLVPSRSPLLPSIRFCFSIHRRIRELLFLFRVFNWKCN